MAVRSALCSGSPLPQGRSLVLISARGWVDPRATVRLQVIGKLRKSNDFTGNRTRDLPACSIVQLTTLPRAPYEMEGYQWYGRRNRDGRLELCKVLYHSIQLKRQRKTTNKKFYEESTAYFPLIRHGPHSRRRLQFFVQARTCLSSLATIGRDFSLARPVQGACIRVRSTL
jgi:hypothetical protein